MGFSEAIKLEVKNRAHFMCVVCHQPFVEIHHILPTEHGGSDDIDNAAPLCAYCHDVYGGNPDKRKQIKQMRDLWYELCDKRFRDAPNHKLAADIDSIKSNVQEQGAILSGVKDLLEKFYYAQTASIESARTVTQLSTTSGISFSSSSSFTRDPNKKYLDELIVPDPLHPPRTDA